MLHWASRMVLAYPPSGTSSTDHELWPFKLPAISCPKTVSHPGTLCQQRCCVNLKSLIMDVWSNIFVTSCSTPCHHPLQPQDTTNLFPGPSVQYRCHSTSFYPMNSKHLTDSCANCHPLPQLQKHKMPDQHQKHRLGNLTYWTFLAISQRYINCVYKHFY